MSSSRSSPLRMPASPMRWYSSTVKRRVGTSDAMLRIRRRSPPPVNVPEPIRYTPQAMSFVSHVECTICGHRGRPTAAIPEAAVAGSTVFPSEGSLAAAGKAVAKVAPQIGWFVLSTLKEPYRLEGKKTMGLELAEQLGWTMPDVLLYPTGGGTGLVGIPKGYEELRAMGWVGDPLPRVIAVQAEGCAPVVKAFHDGADTTAAWESPTTHAAGLRVPSPFAGRQMLKILRDTGGDAVAVSERAIQDAQRLLGRLEGVWTSPEGAALVAALGVLKERRDISADARVVLVLTGAGIKYDPPTRAPACAWSMPRSWSWTPSPACRCRRRRSGSSRTSTSCRAPSSSTGSTASAPTSSARWTRSRAVSRAASCRCTSPSARRRGSRATSTSPR